MPNLLGCDRSPARRTSMVTHSLVQRAAAIALSIRRTSYTMTGAVSAAKRLRRGFNRPFSIDVILRSALDSTGLSAPYLTD